MDTIGFIGLGNMGLPMALNLLKAGYQVIGFDVQPEPLAKFSAAGGIIAEQLEFICQNSSTIVTMLPAGPQVLQVCKEIFKFMSLDSLHIDCSTIDVTTARQIHELAQSHNLQSVDAPVSGGITSAAAGTLTFMVGGTESAFDTAQAILKNMGQKIIHTGIAGNGQAAKICNNMILGISMIAVSESFALADKLGLAAEKLFEVVNNSSGQCWVMSKYVPLPNILDNVPANNHYQAGFESRLMLKDLLSSQHEAQTAALPTPLGAKATELYQQFVNDGHGKIDFSAIIKTILKTEVKDELGEIDPH